MKSTKASTVAAAKRVAAVRAELSATERLAASGVVWAKAAAKALRKDLLVLENRLAEMS